jgi:dipeptidyl aminopeptidase/acylaminoacyl peptidase
VRHRYGPHRDQWGDLLLPSIPAAEGPFPVCVLLHGGNWQAAYGVDMMDGLARDLQRRGWAAWNLEFRRVGPTSGGGWPQTGEDVLAGIDALATLDAPLDLDRVVIVGFSSGGQLALWAAGERRGRDAPVRIRAAVAQAGAVHLACRGVPEVVDFMGATYEEDPARYHQASPAARLPLRVPTLLVHGEQDAVVPSSMSKRYVERARAAGDPVTLVLRSGDGHMEHLDPEGVAWAAVRQWLEPWGP